MKEEKGLKITYTGSEIDSDLDETLIATLEEAGWEFTGSGMELVKGIRDLTFKK